MSFFFSLFFFFADHPDALCFCNVCTEMFGKSI